MTPEQDEHNRLVLEFIAGLAIGITFGIGIILILKDNGWIH